MKYLLNQQYEVYEQSFVESQEKACQFHAHGKCEDPSVYSNLTLERIPHIADGYYYKEAKIGALPAHHAGIYYSQDPAAMLPATLLPLKNKARVLDLCAAPGGKTSQLAARLEETGGVLIANEIHPGRNKILCSNVERMGFTNVLVTKLSAQEFAHAYPSYFDCIVVDAPCSGEGMFRKYPESINEWSLETVDHCQSRQQEILDAILPALKPGGYLLYSTCTYAPEENENRIYDLIHTHGFTLCSPKQFENKAYQSYGLSTLSDCFCQYETKKEQEDFRLTFHMEYEEISFWDSCYRCYPGIHRGEGQFFALLQKPGEELSYEPETLMQLEAQKKLGKLKPVSKKSLDLIQKAFGDSLTLSSFHLYEYNNLIYVLPEDASPLPPHGITQCYVLLGEIIKNRFQPHHQFFHAYGGYFKNQISYPYTADELLKYLKGYELTVPDLPNGYGVITLENVPIGGFKASNGQLKNHYPKALRNHE